ncbi:MAG: YbjQ family protein [Verrucomicrobiota bacterium]
MTPSSIIVTSGNDIAGHEITGYLGIVRGIIVRATGIGPGIIGGLRSIAGGNIPEYAAVCEKARSHAYQTMLDHAKEVGADAVIAFRYDATEFMPGSTEVLAYGTAVKLTRR